MNKMWKCVAIDHGVAIFPNGKIGPCCQVSADYLKPISELANPNRFADLHTAEPPSACERCVVNEYNNIPSYRTFFNSADNNKDNLQFVDIRNTNLCNLKCRYCGPHFSSQWAEELNRFPIIESQSLDEYKHLLVTDSLQWMYFTGGEPMINRTHWELLEELINNKQACNINLLYNTNLTTLKYKDKSIIDIWKQFKSVQIQCSIDAIGEPLEYIRSGSSWEKIKTNIEQLLTNVQNSNIEITFSPVLNILNIWFIDKLYEYATSNNIAVNMIVLTGPDYLALDVIPDSLKHLALDKIDQLESQYNIDTHVISHIRNLINNNINQCLFQHTLSHILLLDKLRDEKLFELLPFKSFAVDSILKNFEYE